MVAPARPGGEFRESRGSADAIRIRETHER